MSTKKNVDIDADKLALYEKLIATIPDVERKGATHPYTSLTGNMFSYLHPRGSVALRLPADEREKFLKNIRRPCSRRMAPSKRSTSPFPMTC